MINFGCTETGIASGCVDWVSDCLVVFWTDWIVVFWDVILQKNFRSEKMSSQKIGGLKVPKIWQGKLQSMEEEDASLSKSCR